MKEITLQESGIRGMMTPMKVSTFGRARSNLSKERLSSLWPPPQSWSPLRITLGRAPASRVRRQLSQRQARFGPASRASRNPPVFRTNKMAIRSVSNIGSNLTQVMTQNPSYCIAPTSNSPTENMNCLSICYCSQFQYRLSKSVHTLDIYVPTKWQWNCNSFY